MEGLPSLTHLLLIAEKANDTRLIRLHNLRELRGLWLQTSLGGSGEITNEGLKIIKCLPKLKDLKLAAQKGISDAGLVYLEELPELVSLDLNFTNVTDAGLAHLKYKAKLQTLKLDFTKITDSGLEHLREMTQLTKLDLEQYDDYR